MLRVSEVSHAYRRRGAMVLRDVSLTFTPGVTALVGANGAGKSTLLKALSGGLRPTHGSVEVAGLDPYARGERDAALRKVALMPQTAQAPRAMTLRQFVSYLTWMRGVSRAEAGEWAAAALDDVGLGQRLDVKLGVLSGGMVRRVWLAQALAAQAEVLLLDEPSTGLDPKQRARMVELIAERATGTVLLSSHLIEDVQALASRVIVLDEGRVAFDGELTAGMDAGWLLTLLGEET